MTVVGRDLVEEERLGALDLLRSLRDRGEEPQVTLIAATDPANPYGSTLRFPQPPNPHSRAAAPAVDPTGGRANAPQSTRGATRTVGASVILVDGALTGYLARGDRLLLAWIPDDEPARSRHARALAAALLDRARSGGESPRGMLIEEINGTPAAVHPLAAFFLEHGFIAGAMGLSLPRRNLASEPSAHLAG